MYWISTNVWGSHDFWQAVWTSSVKTSQQRSIMAQPFLSYLTASLPSRRIVSLRRHNSEGKENSLSLALSPARRSTRHQIWELVHRNWAERKRPIDSRVESRLLDFLNSNVSIPYWIHIGRREGEIQGFRVKKGLSYELFCNSSRV